MSEPLIGLQMYSMKKYAEYDLLSTLQCIKNMGYEAHHYAREFMQSTLTKNEYVIDDCCIGQGEIDFHSNLPTLSNLSNKLLFLEQQYNKVHGIEHARKNISYIKQLLQNVNYTYS